ncbi:hypothetical protein DFP73DRAFT_608936, partial [Morchella snyderi]
FNYLSQVSSSDYLSKEIIYIIKTQLLDIYYHKISILNPTMSMSTMMIEGPEVYSAVLPQQPIGVLPNQFPIENLSCDLMVNVMMNMGSFQDLRRLIRVSPKSRYTFKMYKNSIRSQVAKNLFGESYKVITTILRYRDHSFPLARNRLDYATSEALVNKHFIFNTLDIDRAEIILLSFKTALAKYQAANFKLSRDPHTPQANDDILPPSFSQANPFSLDLFLRTLRRFQQHMFENIDTYIETLPSKKHEVDIYWVSRVISLANEPRNFGNFTVSWGCSLDNERFEELSGRPLLAAKFEHTFLNVVDGLSTSAEDAEDLTSEFYNDYDLGGGKGHMAMMIAKYKMNGAYARIGV